MAASNYDIYDDDEDLVHFICSNTIKIKSGEKYTLLASASTSLTVSYTYALTDSIDDQNYNTIYNFHWIYKDPFFASKSLDILKEMSRKKSRDLPKKVIEAKYDHPLSVAIVDELGEWVRIIRETANSASQVPTLIDVVGIDETEVTDVLGKIRSITNSRFSRRAL